MWTLLTGYLLSTFFEYQIVKLFKNKFLKNTLSFYGVLLGWLFQEYTRKNFSLTGGKKFILESDFRNRLFTQIFKIVKNLIMYPYLITTLELSTFIILFLFFSIILIKPNNKLKLKKIFIKNYRIFVNENHIFIYENWKIIRNNVFLLLFLSCIFRYTFLKTYFLYDIFFVFMPIFFSSFLIFQLYACFLIVYLIYIYIVYNSIINLALTLKVFMIKLTFYFLSIFFSFLFFFQDLNLQNLTTENFLKEFLFKIFFIFFQIVCLKQNLNKY